MLLSLAVGLLAALADIAGGLPVAGSLAFGAAWVGIGWVSIGLTAVACQLSASSRTCSASPAAALGLLYALRAVGDVGTGVALVADAVRLVDPAPRLVRPPVVGAAPLPGARSGAAGGGGRA